MTRTESQPPHTIALSGSLTMQTVGAVYRDVEQMPDGCELTLDMSRVETVDSSALALITALARKAHDAGSSVTLRALPKSIASVIHIYGLSDILKPYIQIDA